MRTRRANVHIFQHIIGTARISGVMSAFPPATLTMTMNCDYGGRGARTSRSQPRSEVKLIQPGTLITRLLYAVVCAIRDSRYCCIDFACTRVGRACLAPRACEPLMPLLTY